MGMLNAFGYMLKRELGNETFRQNATNVLFTFYSNILMIDGKGWSIAWIPSLSLYRLVSEHLEEFFVSLTLLMISPLRSCWL